MVLVVPYFVNIVGLFKVTQGNFRREDETGDLYTTYSQTQIEQISKYIFLSILHIRKRIVILTFKWLDVQNLFLFETE